MVQLEIRTLGFKRFLKDAANAPEAIRKAAARTLNETLTKSQSLMAKQAAASYRITQRDIRASFRSHTANANDLNASVQSGLRISSVGLSQPYPDGDIKRSKKVLETCVFGRQYFRSQFTNSP